MSNQAVLPQSSGRQVETVNNTLEPIKPSVIEGQGTISNFQTSNPKKPVVSTNLVFKSRASYLEALQEIAGKTSLSVYQDRAREATGETPPLSDSK